MKTLNLNPVNAAMACLLFFSLISCAPKVPGSWRNEKISEGRRDDFHKLNTAALNYLKTNDAKGLKVLLSKEMIEDNNAKAVDKISNRLNDNLYELLDEYYVVNKYKDTDTVASVGGAMNRYSLVYPYTAPEMYFAFFAPKKPQNKYMLSLVYAKFDYGWKIIKMDVAPYTINGKTAPELYAMARDQYSKKQVQAALDNLELAVTCFKPSPYWQYPDDADAGKLYTIVHTLVKYKYHYPMILTQVATGPKILRVYNKSLDDGSYPDVYYMTHFNLKDTNAVKKENLQIRSALGKLMPGLDQNNKYILYSAFNKLPSGYETIDHFDMMDKVH